MPTIDYLHDAQTVLEDGAGAITSSSAGSGTLTLGAGQVAPGTGVAVSVTALDLTDTNETYFMDVEGSNDSFSTAITLGRVEITATGMYFAAFSNFQGGTIYQDVRAYFTLAGTTPSITCVAAVTGNN